MSARTVGYLYLIVCPLRCHGRHMNRICNRRWTRRKYASAEEGIEPRTAIAYPSFGCSLQGLPAANQKAALMITVYWKWEEVKITPY
jgi:hypothetical protein